jgi:hypothetical protein
MTEKQRPLVDEKCFDLALAFLNEIKGTTDDDLWALAKVIQDACEDACREVEERGVPEQEVGD